MGDAVEIIMVGGIIQLIMVGGIVRIIIMEEMVVTMVNYLIIMPLTMGMVVAITAHAILIIHHRG